MSANQNIRYGPPNPANEDNPQSLIGSVKPSRIIVNNSNPLPTTGENKWYFINSVTGDLFEKENGQWFQIYNFDTGTIAGITNIENIPSAGSVGLFKTIVGNTAFFKNIQGASLKIDVDDTGDKLIIDIPNTYKPSTLSRINNFPLNVGLSAGSIDPNINLGTGQGYNKGSLFIQYDNILWVCIEPDSPSVWSKLITPDGGLSNIENVGSGAAVLLDIVSGTARLKRLQGTSNEIDVDSSSVFQTNTIRMNDLYKPVTLSNVDNVKIGYNNSTPPLGTDDITKGYIIGSIYTEVQPGGNNQLWIARAVTPAGSAQWEDYGTDNERQKDYSNWAGIGGQPQTINFNYADVNFGAGVPINYAFPAGTGFSTLFDGARQVFRRAAVTKETAYNVTLSMKVQDFESSTLRPANYEIHFIRKTGGFIAVQSQIGFVIPVHETSASQQSVSVSFVYDESLLTQQDYYFQIRGRLGPPGPDQEAQDIDINYWSVAFSEI